MVTNRYKTSYPNSPLWNLKEAAAYCHCSIDLLNKLAREGGGPIRLKLGRKTLFRKADIDAWIESQADSVERNATN